jgi:hypothetical protein
VELSFHALATLVHFGFVEILRLFSRHAVGHIRFVGGTRIKLYQFGTQPRMEDKLLKSS